MISLIEHSRVKSGLQIGHIEKTQGKKIQNTRKNSITQGKNSRSQQIFASTSGTKPCVLLLKTHSSW